ncbi:MAG: hypothetical protein JRN52_01715 [Nitrososphaerota archaeon]|nr:hypothetical protein [Nitrososphaerota archaeon]
MKRILLPKISIAYIPRTSNRKDPEKKEELRDRIRAAIVSSGNDFEELKQNCLKEDYLSLDVTYRLYNDPKVEGRSRKDLDNLLKILLDVLPEKLSIQDNKGRKGLGIISDDKDTKIFEICCRKKLVEVESEEGMDLEIYALDEAEARLAPKV